MKGLPLALLISLVLTLLLESLFFWLSGRRERRDWQLLLLVNLLTNPPVVLLYLLLTTQIVSAAWLAWPLKLLLEAAVILVEGAYYRRYGQGFRRPFAFALGANLFSFTLAELGQWLFR